MSIREPIYQQLKLRDIQRDPDQPRRDFGTEGEQNRLLISIKQYGLKYPISVCDFGEGKYLIIDGHRRYNCATKLGLESVACLVYPKLSVGDLETGRFEMQNNRRPWNTMEKSDALERIKAARGIQTNKELAVLLGTTATAVSNSLQLRRQRLEYIELMVKFAIPATGQNQFISLKAKLRKIKEIEADQIIILLLEKYQMNVIKNIKKELQRLGRIFEQASFHEEDLYTFLTTPEMGVRELEDITQLSGFSGIIQQLVEKISRKQQEGVEFTEKEQVFLEEFRVLLNGIVINPA